ncbi:MAG: hypothetical protein A2Y73_07270 [Chloroflexi bacterium RBG_13_56_8]|nr:MAG: hypothetical protein A2Y73_07270 [Chloroflexi bacterium RBG_13_56_8]
MAIVLVPLLVMLLITVIDSDPPCKETSQDQDRRIHRATIKRERGRMRTGSELQALSSFVVRRQYVRGGARWWWE